MWTLSSLIVTPLKIISLSLSLSLSHTHTHTHKINSRTRLLNHTVTHRSGEVICGERAVSPAEPRLAHTLRLTQSLAHAAAGHWVAVRIDVLASALTRAGTGPRASLGTVGTEAREETSVGCTATATAAAGGGGVGADGESDAWLIGIAQGTIVAGQAGAARVCCAAAGPSVYLGALCRSSAVFAAKQ